MTHDPAPMTLAGLALWDGTTARGASSITWAGDRIVAVEEARPGPAGLSVIPGLVDTHVHLGANAGDEPADFLAWPLMTPSEERTLHIAANAMKAVRAGVTTLRDLAGDHRQLAVSRAFEQGILPGPRVRVHGQVGMTAGHGDLFIPPHYPHRDPVADSPDECRKLVRQWARIGAHGVKIYTSGGVLSVGDGVGRRNHTTAEIRATIDEAHALGLAVAAHTHSAAGLDTALAEGADSIEHGTGIAEQHWALMRERNVPVAPTLLINDVIASGRAPGLAHARQKAREVVAERDGNFAAAARAGVRFVLGTDANGAMVGFGDQFDEVRRMRQAFGWSAERALVAATSDAADAIRMGDLVGRIAPGYGADFVVVEGRPWEDIDELRHENVVAVVSRGRVVAGRLPE